mmetsp:Transcript_46064/g.144147  ORF Transcript_46064/g.144147 Transcript_46064/m.144147 type:complete len:731 (+) Transcript_46064:329-2521(+)
MLIRMPLTLHLVDDLGHDGEQRRHAVLALLLVGGGHGDALAARAPRCAEPAAPARAQHGAAVHLARRGGAEALELGVHGVEHLLEVGEVLLALRAAQLDIPEVFLLLRDGHEGPPRQRARVVGLCRSRGPLAVAESRPNDVLPLLGDVLILLHVVARQRPRHVHVFDDGRVRDVVVVVAGQRVVQRVAQRVHGRPKLPGVLGLGVHVLLQEAARQPLHQRVDPVLVGAQLRRRLVVHRRRAAGLAGLHAVARRVGLVLREAAGVHPSDEEIVGLLLARHEGLRHGHDGLGEDGLGVPPLEHFDLLLHRLVALDGVLQDLVPRLQEVLRPRQRLVIHARHLVARVRGPLRAAVGDAPPRRLGHELQARPPAGPAHLGGLEGVEQHLQRLALAVLAASPQERVPVEEDALDAREVADAGEVRLVLDEVEREVQRLQLREAPAHALLVGLRRRRPRRFRICFCLCCPRGPRLVLLAAAVLLRLGARGAAVVHQARRLQQRRARHLRDEVVREAELAQRRHARDAVEEPRRVLEVVPLEHELGQPREAAHDVAGRQELDAVAREVQLLEPGQRRELGDALGVEAVVAEVQPREALEEGAGAELRHDRVQRVQPVALHAQVLERRQQREVARLQLVIAADVKEAQLGEEPDVVLRHLGEAPVAAVHVLRVRRQVRPRNLEQQVAVEDALPPRHDALDLRARLGHRAQRTDARERRQLRLQPALRRDGHGHRVRRE